MKKLRNLGKVLNRQEQKRIIGGGDYGCDNPKTYYCYPVCCDGTYFEISIPACDAVEATNAAANYCSNHDGYDFGCCDAAS
jgi:hypothetical protein